MKNKEVKNCDNCGYEEFIQCVKCIDAEPPRYQLWQPKGFLKEKGILVEIKRHQKSGVVVVYKIFADSWDELILKGETKKFKLVPVHEVKK